MNLYEGLSLGIAVIGFTILIYQLTQLNRQVHSDGLNYLYTQSGSIREILLNKPYLIKYFRSGETITSDDKYYDEALIVAELYLNYFEHLAIQQMNLRKNDWETWLNIMEDVIAQSPITIEQYRNRKNWYAPILQDLIAKINPSY